MRASVKRTPGRLLAATVCFWAALFLASLKIGVLEGEDGRLLVSGDLELVPIFGFLLSGLAYHLSIGASLVRGLVTRKLDPAIPWILAGTAIGYVIGWWQPAAVITLAVCAKYVNSDVLWMGRGIAGIGVGATSAALWLVLHRSPKTS